MAINVQNARKLLYCKITRQITAAPIYKITLRQYRVCKSRVDFRRKIQSGPPIVSYYLALRQKHSGPPKVSHLAITEMVPDLIWAHDLLGLKKFGPREIWFPRNLGPEKFGPQECWSLHENAI